MSLLDWFRRRKPAVPLPQLCYDVAYFILPHYAHEDPERIADMCRDMPTMAGPFFYVMACRARGAEPDMEEARKFRWHHGELAGGREYFALEYPAPPPVDLSDVPLEQLVGGERPVVLAPHFSATVRGGEAGESDYFILGQAPMGGGTTLRCVLRGGRNCNLGPGPEPRLEAFLDAVRERLESRG